MTARLHLVGWRRLPLLLPSLLLLLLFIVPLFQQLHFVAATDAPRFLPCGDAHTNIRFPFQPSWRTLGATTVLENCPHVVGLFLYRFAAKQKLHVRNCTIQLIMWREGGNGTEDADSEVHIYSNTVTGLLSMPQIESLDINRYLSVGHKVVNISFNNFTSSNYSAHLKEVWHEVNRQPSIVDISSHFRDYTAPSENSAAGSSYSSGQHIVFVGNSIFKPSRIRGSSGTSGDNVSIPELQNRFSWFKVAAFSMASNSNFRTLESITFDNNNIHLERFDGWGAMWPGWLGGPVNVQYSNSAPVFFYSESWHNMRLLSVSGNTLRFLTGGGCPGGIMFSAPVHFGSSNGNHNNRQAGVLFRSIKMNSNTVEWSLIQNRAEWDIERNVNREEAAAISFNMGHFRSFANQKNWGAIDLLEMSNNNINASYMYFDNGQLTGAQLTALALTIKTSAGSPMYGLSLAQLRELFFLEVLSGLRFENKGTVHAGAVRNVSACQNRIHLLSVWKTRNIDIMLDSTAPPPDTTRAITLNDNSGSSGAADDMYFVTLTIPSFDGELVVARNFWTEGMPLDPVTKRPLQWGDLNVIAVTSGTNNLENVPPIPGPLGWNATLFVIEDNVAMLQNVGSRTIGVLVELFFMVAHHVATRHTLVRNNTISIGSQQQPAAVRGDFDEQVGGTINCIRFRSGLEADMGLIEIVNNTCEMFFDSTFDAKFVEESISVAGVFWLSQIELGPYDECFRCGAQEQHNGVHSNLRHFLIHHNSFVLSDAGFPAIRSSAACVTFMFAAPALNMGSLDIVDNICVLQHFRVCSAMTGCAFLLIRPVNRTLGMGQVRLERNVFNLSYFELSETLKSREQHSPQPTALVTVSPSVLKLLPPSVNLVSPSLSFHLGWEVALPSTFDLHTLVIKQNRLLAPRSRVDGELAFLFIQVCAPQRFQHIIVAENSIVSSSSPSSSASSSSSSSSPIPSPLSSFAAVSIRPQVAASRLQLGAKQKQEVSSKTNGLNLVDTMLFIASSNASLTIERTLRLVNNSILDSSSPSSSSSSSSSASPGGHMIAMLRFEDNFHLLPDFVRKPVIPGVGFLNHRPLDVTIGAQAYIDPFPPSLSATATTTTTTSTKVPVLQNAHFFALLRKSFAPSYAAVLAMRTAWRKEFARRQRATEWDMDYAGVDPKFEWNTTTKTWLPPLEKEIQKQQQQQKQRSTQVEAAAASTSRSHFATNILAKRIGGIYSINNTVRTTDSAVALKADLSAQWWSGQSSLFALHGHGRVRNVTLAGAFVSFGDRYEITTEASSGAQRTPQLVQFSPPFPLSNPVDGGTWTGLPQFVVIENSSFRVICNAPSNSPIIKFECGRLFDTSVDFPTQIDVKHRCFAAETTVWPVTVDSSNNNDSSLMSYATEDALFPPHRHGASSVAIVSSDLHFRRSDAAKLSSFAALTLPWLWAAPPPSFSSVFSGGSTSLLEPPTLWIRNTSITTEMAESPPSQLVSNDIFILVPVTASINSSHLQIRFPTSISSGRLAAPLSIVTLSASSQQLLQPSWSSSLAAASTSVPETIEQILKRIKNGRDFYFEQAAIAAPLFATETTENLRLLYSGASPELFAEWKRSGIFVHVRCATFNDNNLRRGNPFFDGLTSLAPRATAQDRQSNFACRHTETRSQSPSVSIVPMCADFTLQYSGSPLDMGAIAKRQRARGGAEKVVIVAPFLLVPNRITDAPARQGVPDNMPLLPGAVQSESVTIFRSGLHNITVPARARSADSAQATLLSASSGGSNGKLLTLTFLLGPAITTDSNHVVVFELHSDLLACRWGRTRGRKGNKDSDSLDVNASSESSSSAADWFEARVSISRANQGGVPASVQSASAAAATVAVMLGAPLSGPLVGGTLARAGAVLQFAECSFSMAEESPMPFIENPLGLGVGASFGFWRRGALWGALIIMLIITLVLMLIAWVRVIASKRRHARWMQKHMAELQKHRSIVAKSSQKSRNNKNKNGGDNSKARSSGVVNLRQFSSELNAAADSGDDDDDRDDNGNNANTTSSKVDDHHRRLIRAASQRRLNDLESSRGLHEPAIVGFREAFYLIKGPSTSIIPMSILIQGIVSSFVALIVGGLTWNDRLLGVVFGIAFFGWYGWCLHVVFVQMPARPLLVWMPEKRDNRRRLFGFWGLPDEDNDEESGAYNKRHQRRAGPAERQTRAIFGSCPQCGSAQSILQAQKEKAKAAREQQQRELEYQANLQRKQRRRSSAPGVDGGGGVSWENRCGMIGGASRENSHIAENNSNNDDKNYDNSNSRHVARRGNDLFAALLLSDRDRDDSALAASAEKSQPKRRDLLHRRPIQFFVKFVVDAVIYPYGEWTMLRDKKAALEKLTHSVQTAQRRRSTIVSVETAEAAETKLQEQRAKDEKDFSVRLMEQAKTRREEIAASPDDPTFFLRTEEAYASVGGHARWFVMFDFGLNIVVAILSGVQTVIADCTVNELIVTALNVVPFLIMLGLWPVFADRFDSIFGVVSSLLIVQMSLASLLSEAFPSLSGGSAVTEYINLVLGGLGMFKGVADALAIFMAVETWLVLPALFLCHVLFHEGGPLEDVLRWWEGRTRNASGEYDDGGLTAEEAELQEYEATLLDKKGKEQQTVAERKGVDAALTREQRWLTINMAKQLPLDAARRNTPTNCWNIESDGILAPRAAEGLKEGTMMNPSSPKPHQKLGFQTPTQGPSTTSSAAAAVHQQRPATSPRSPAPSRQQQERQESAKIKSVAPTWIEL